jgi:signal transduction histidine kinase
VVARSVTKLTSGVTQPPLADVCLAAALGIAGLVEVVLTTNDAAVLAPAVVATVVPLAWRRQVPFAAIVACLIVVTAAERFRYPLQATYLLLELVVAFYSLGAWVDFRRSLARAAAALAFVWGLIAWQEPRLDNFVFVTLFYAGSWLVGVFVRRPRQRAQELEQSTAELEAAHRQAAQRTVEEERARIARELHDVVAHSVSVMVIQAGAVRRRLGEAQAREREALQGVERAGREALDEMRLMTGILRGSYEPAALAPQPGMDDLERLVDQVRSAGLAVDLRMTGEHSVPPGLALTVYRVVQEALTNVLKHAGPARAEVVISVGPRSVDLEVHDDGSGAHGGNGRGTGQGLIGMRERVAVYGGTFAAQPGDRGGFTVRAYLPFQEVGR